MAPNCQGVLPPPPSTSSTLVHPPGAPIDLMVNLTKGTAEGPTACSPRKGKILQRRAEPDSNPNLSDAVTLTPRVLLVTQAGYEQLMG